MLNHLFLPFLMLFMSGVFACAQAPLFSRALTADNTITGLGLFTFDSFDSGDPDFSVSGNNGMARQYHSSRRKDNGDVAAGQGIDTSFVGWTAIFGRLLTGPGAPVLLGTNAFVGDLNWCNEAVPGIQPGYLVTNYNEVYPSVTAPVGQLQPLTNVSVPWTYYSEVRYAGCNSTPSGSGSFIITNTVEVSSVEYPTDCFVGPVSTNWNEETVVSFTFEQIVGYTEVFHYSITNNFDYLFSDGAYTVSSLAGKIMVAGQASIHVTGDVNITGQGGIWVQTNSSCKLFVAGANTTLRGQGLKNLTGDASKFQYFGFPSNKSLFVGDTTPFWGTIYAPQASVTFSGGGSDQNELIGAIVCESAHFNGKFGIHYDERLRLIGPTTAPLLTIAGSAEPNELSFLLTGLEHGRLYWLQSASTPTGGWTNVTSFSGSTFTENLTVPTDIQNSRFFRLFSQQ